jgi:hypothetical protein
VPLCWFSAEWRATGPSPEKKRQLIEPKQGGQLNAGHSNRRVFADNLIKWRATHNKASNTYIINISI